MDVNKNNNNILEDINKFYYTYKPICTHLHTHRYAHAYTQTDMHLYTHRPIFIRIHTNWYKHIHRTIYTHIHTNRYAQTYAQSDTDIHTNWYAHNYAFLVCIFWHIFSYLFSLLYILWRVSRGCVVSCQIFVAYIPFFIVILFTKKKRSLDSIGKI